MEKVHYILIGILIVILAIGGFCYWAFGSPTVKAQLLIESGTVQVDTGSGYVTATDGMKLSTSDKVKNVDGDASVVLHEGVVIALDAGAEVIIEDLSKDNLKVSQPEGQTWTKFSKVTGVSSLEVATPVTVATVRGTFFGLRRDRLMSGEGRVEGRVGSSSLTLNGVQKVVARDGAPAYEELTADERRELTTQQQRTVKYLRKIRELEVRKHRFVMSMVEKRYGLTVDEALTKLQELDDNQVDLNQIVAQAPVTPPGLYKVKELTNVIRQVKKQAKQLPPPPPQAGTPTGGQGTSATAQCPGGENCCCQYGWPDCGPDYECRGWRPPGMPSFGTCVKKGTHPGAPLQLHHSQPAGCQR